MTINSEPNRPDRWRSPEFANSWSAANQTMLTEQSIRKRLVSALPFQPGDTIRVLDVGTGDGALGLEVLTAYPKAQLVCHDYSEAMLAHARLQLAQFSPSVSFVKSDLKYPEWTHVIEGSFDAVVSSIAIHNVAEQSVDSGSDRIPAIYAEIFSLLKPGGCFFNFEFVSPPGLVTEGIYLKKLIDDYQARPKVEIRGERSSQEFEAVMLRHLRHVHTPLSDQLNWLRQAQFDEADCLWKDTQTAIIVGFRR
jgi:tRNA (cmo5U34)-methyltransferase